MEPTVPENTDEYKFCPTDDEVIFIYLPKKVGGQPLPDPHPILDVDVYNFSPEVLFENYRRPFQRHCYFFTTHPSGNNPRRAVGDGFWIAIFDDPIIDGGQTFGYKKILTFCRGEYPGPLSETNWVMEEYRLILPPVRPNILLKCVLCRVWEMGEAELDISEDILTDEEVFSTGR